MSLWSCSTSSQLGFSSTAIFRFSSSRGGAAQFLVRRQSTKTTMYEFYTVSLYALSLRESACAVQAFAACYDVAALSGLSESMIVFTILLQDLSSMQVHNTFSTAEKGILSGEDCTPHAIISGRINTIRLS